MVAGDAGWFFFEYFDRSRWDVHSDDVPEIPKQKIQSEKCLISMIWRSTVIKNLLYVPKGMKYNTTFFVELVVPDLVEQVCSESRRKMLRGTVSHLDNARLHNSRENKAALIATKARRIPAPAYNPDLSPSDFFLFGMLKERMSGALYSSPDNLISAIHLREISVSARLHRIVNRMTVYISCVSAIPTSSSSSSTPS
jgi:hypothetical protein